MDPKAALLAILRGHEISDHIEALDSWIATGGFLPEVELADGLGLPLSAMATNAMPTGKAKRAAADRRGIWASYKAQGFDWRLVADWADLVNAFCEPESESATACDFDECDADATEARGPMQYCATHASEHDALDHE